MDHHFPPLLTRISRTVRMRGCEDTGLESMTWKAEIPHLLKKIHKGPFDAFAEQSTRWNQNDPVEAPLHFAVAASGPGSETPWGSNRRDRYMPGFSKPVWGVLGQIFLWILFIYFVLKSVSKLRLALHLLDFTTAWYITFSFPFFW